MSKTYCTKGHGYGQHDASCMPPADPANPELRLIRAIFGLCPECNNRGLHVHQIPESMAGCWIDGHNGWHANYQVVDIAFDWGWHPEDETEVRRVRNLYATDDADDEITGDMIDQGGYTDRATEYLESIAAEGCYFEWDGGELFYRKDDDNGPE